MHQLLVLHFIPFHFSPVFGAIVIPFHSVSFGCHFANSSVQLSFNLDFSSHHHHQLCASHEPENKLYSRAKAVSSERKKKKQKMSQEKGETKCLFPSNSSTSPLRKNA